MNTRFSLQQIQKTSNLDPNFISRQYKLNLMAKFMQIKFENPKLKQSEIADQLGCSSSTLQRYRNDLNMLSPYRIQPNITNKRSKKVLNTNFDKTSSPKHDLERPQMTSLNLTQIQNLIRELNTLKGGSVH